jgi:hypothetical protein
METQMHPTASAQKSVSLFIVAILFSLPILTLAKPIVLGDASDQRVETRVYLEPRCFASEEAPRVVMAIAAVLLPIIIEKAIGAASGAIRSAGKKEPLQDSGRTPIYLYKVRDEIPENAKPAVTASVSGPAPSATPSPSPTPIRKIELNPSLNGGCVIIVRGKFDSNSIAKPSTSPTPSPSPQPSLAFETNNPQLFGADDESEAKRIKRLNDIGIPVKEIALLFEAKVTVSDDRTAIRYESQYLEIKTFQGKRSQDKPRGVVINIAMNGAGAKEDASLMSLATINLGEVSRKANGERIIMTPKSLEGYKTGWLSGPLMTKDVITLIQNLDLGDEKYKEVFPATIVGTVTETENGSAALRFIADLLDATKKDVAKEISGELLKDREAEASKEANVLESARQQEEKAYADYLTAKVNLAKSQADKKRVDETPGSSEESKDAAAKDVELKAALEKIAIRVWCEKYKALKNLGEDSMPSDRPTNLCNFN